VTYHFFRNAVSIAAIFFLQINWVYADTTAEWLAASKTGNWITPSNWSTSPSFPNNGTPAGATYQALVDLPGAGSYTITLANSVAVNGLTMNAANATLSHTAGTLTLSNLNLQAGTYLLKGGVLSGGTLGGVVAISPGAQLQMTAGSLDRLTFTGSDIAFSSQLGSLSITNGLDLSGNSLSLSNTFSSIVFNGISQTIDHINLNLSPSFANNTNSNNLFIGGPNSVGSVTLTLGSHATISGDGFVGNYGTTDNLINNGTLNANFSKNTLSVVPTNFTNHGLAQATGGAILSIASTTWNNASDGVISVNASTLNLAGSWTNTGAITATNASVVNLGGSFRVADIQSLVASADTTVAITGTLTSSGPVITFNNVASPWKLSGGTVQFATVNFGNNLSIVNGTLSNVTVANGGSINVASGGTLAMAGTWNNLGAINAGANATLNLGGTFTTAGIGSINTTSTDTINITGNLDNSGAILSIPGVFSAGQVFNGTIGADLNLVTGSLVRPTIAPSVTVTAVFGGFFGPLNNLGTINVPANGNITLGGTFTMATLGKFNTVPSSAVAITGFLDNTNLNFVTQVPWQLNGTLSGGTVGCNLNMKDASGTFLGVNIASISTVQISPNNIAFFHGTWTNFGTISAASSSIVTTDPWTNNGTISFTNPGLTSHLQAAGTWTNNGTITGGPLTSIFTTGAWVNSGFISVTGDGSNFSPTGPVATWMNSKDATIAVSNNADISFGGAGTNSGVISIDHANLNLSGSNFVNHGTFKLSKANVISIFGISGPAPIDIGDGTIAGSGTIDGGLHLSDPSHLSFGIGGINPATDYDSFTIKGANVMLAGELDVNFTNGFQSFITSNEAFTVLTLSGSISMAGSFSNVADGGMLATTDGYGLFQVNYGSGINAGKIVLSNFVAIPEPLSIGNLALIALIIRRRSKPKISIDR
jgi:hypothetical protein